MTTRVTPVLLLLVALLVVVRFVNRSADFPADRNWSRDIYTDEGWYNRAATEHVLSGSWYVPGDMNTGINHPISPLIQRATFAVFGRSLSSARLTVCAAFTLTIALVFVLAWRFADPLGAALVTLLLGVNFFVFAYSRIATLDVLSTMFAVAALVAVMRRDRPPGPGQLAAGGILLSLAILTKGSAIFAVPLVAASAWLPGQPLRANLRPSLIILLLTILVVGSYTLIAWRAYPEDYADYLGTVTPNSSNVFETTRRAAEQVPWLGRGFLAGTSLLALMGMVLSDAYRRSRLTWLCVAWLGVFLVLMGTATYVAPRYFIPLVIPLSVLAGTALARIVAERHSLIVAGLAWMVLGGIVTIEGRKFIEYVREPRYSYVEMARQVAATVRNGRGTDDTGPVRLVGAVADSVGLETGLLTLGTMYGPKPIGWKLDHYRPAYWIMFGDEDLRPEFESRYQLTEIGSWDVFGSYDKNPPVRLFALERRRSATR